MISHLAEVHLGREPALNRIVPPCDHMERIPVAIVWRKRDLSLADFVPKGHAVFSAVVVRVPKDERIGQKRIRFVAVDHDTTMSQACRANTKRKVRWLEATLDTNIFMGATLFVPSINLLHSPGLHTAPFTLRMPDNVDTHSACSSVLSLATIDAPWRPAGVGPSGHRLGHAEQKRLPMRVPSMSVKIPWKSHDHLAIPGTPESPAKVMLANMVVAAP